MKKLGLFLFNFVSNIALLLAMTSMSQCSARKLHQSPVDEDLKNNTRKAFHKRFSNGADE